MSGQDERLAAIIAGLIPYGAVLILDTYRRQWFRPEGCGLVVSRYEAAIYAGDSSLAKEATRESVYSAAVELTDTPPPGSIVELLAKRIAELEDERSEWQSTAFNLGHEVATLRGILASVPPPEDDEP